LDGGTGTGADVVIRTGEGGVANNNAHLSFRANSTLQFYVGRISSQNGIFNGSAAMILGFSTASMVQFFGTTSSFPALKRNSTALETKLADDSAYAPHAMQYLDINDGITAPAAATGRARIYVDTADGDLKVIFADGTIKTIATDT
jgi:hypothetical protein